MNRELINLDEFIFQQLRSLENFENWWREKNEKDEEVFPMEMREGDWLEQLNFHAQNETRND